jgi:hypothetical protein
MWELLGLDIEIVRERCRLKVVEEKEVCGLESENDPFLLGLI